MKTALELLNRYHPHASWQKGSRTEEDILSAMEAYASQKSVSEVSKIPLSEITDEDLIRVAKMNRYTGTNPTNQIKVGKDILKRVFEEKDSNMCLPFECADYLRFKGYNIPNLYEL